MIRLLVLASLVASCAAQEPSLSAILSFESDHHGSAPAGWNIGPNAAVVVDNKIVHGGQWSARIERTATTPGQFGGILKFIPMDFAGSRIEMRGFLRTDSVTEYVGMWMREDGESGSVAFDNMQSRQLKGTNDWQEYSISLPLRPEGRQLFFGVFVAGTGTVWVDDLQLLVDGKPVWDAPKADRPKTIVDTDHEFDSGSGISFSELTPAQIGNLVLLGKIWGFLKYHHPAVTTGSRHWDYDLFRVMPAVLAAPSRAAAQDAIAKWIGNLGPLPKCDPCATLKTTGLHLHPRLEWLEDRQLLNDGLRQLLHAVYVSRPVKGSQFYLGQARGVGNPEFRPEPAYTRLKPGDAGFQLLGLYRFWNIIEYWSPYRDVLGENWDEVLKEHIPKIALAKTADAYQREMMALIARAHDTHANLWSSLNVRPPVGECQVPVILRFVENQPVVTGFPSDAGKTIGLHVGDVIAELDGVPVSKLVADWTPYYADSNDAARQRDMARSMTRGSCGDLALRVRRGTEALTVQTQRVPIRTVDMRAGATHDLPGDTFRRLSPEIAYLKLSSVKIADAASYIDSAANSKGLIIDIRNYPSEFVVFALGQRLVGSPTPFVRFTQGDLSNPGAFHWGDPLSLTPDQPHYSGKIVILIDEVSQSQAEYTTMAFRSVPGAKVIGSTTAGADGNVSEIPLPGGLRTMISGIGVFYPDKTPTQRVGIVPDIVVRPTIAGIREGRDEVLEAAVRQILGQDITPAEIRKLIEH
jgi:C-terminal processing protease CtpA/Prc